MAIDYTEVIADLRQRASAFTQIADSLEALLGPAPAEAATGLALPSAPKETIAALVIRIASEPQERTSISITDCVQEARPELPRTSIQSTIFSLIKAGRLYKTPDLTVRPVMNGVPQRGATSSGQTSQSAIR